MRHRFELIVPLVLSVGCHGEPTPHESARWKPIESMAVAPLTGTWNKPDNAGPEWPDKVHELLENLIPDALSTEIVERSPPNTLRVVPAAEVRNRHLPAMTPQELGAAFSVNAVLVGSVKPDGVAKFEFIDVESGRVLWSDSYRLYFGPSEFHDWRVSMISEDISDVVDSVIRKVTGKKAPPPKPLD
jgi:TolB-like protein